MQIEKHDNTAFSALVVIEITDAFDLHLKPQRPAWASVEDCLRPEQEKFCRR